MDYKFSQLSRENLLNLELFFKKVYSGTVQYGTREQFEWKIFNNPVHLGIVNAALSNNSIVSSTSLTPKSLFINGTQVNAAEIGDTYTDENHQRKGLFATLVNKTRTEGIENGLVYIYGTPNSNSLPGYLKKCDFAVASNLNVFGYCSILKFSASKNKSALFNFLIKLMNEIISIPLGFYFKFRSHGVNLTEINQFDSGFDALWENVKNDYNYVFKRDSLSLNWRFLKSPFTYKKYGIYQNSSVVGYIITREDAASSTLYIADYLISKSNIHMLEKATSKILAKALVGNFNKVYAWGSSSDYALKAFTKNIFIKRSSVPIIIFRNNATTKISNLKTYHFSMSDSDNI